MLKDEGKKSGLNHIFGVLPAQSLLFVPHRVSAPAEPGQKNNAWRGAVTCAKLAFVRWVLQHKSDHGPPTRFWRTAAFSDSYRTGIRNSEGRCRTLGCLRPCPVRVLRKSRAGDYFGST